MDPFTLLAGASAAFKGVQTLVNHGRDIEDVFVQLSKWATYVSDIQEWCREAEKPPSIFKKLTFQDDTAAALQVVQAKIKVQQQEKEIREMFQWYGPPGMYEEFIKERRRIKDQREKTIYEQARRRRAFVKTVIDAVAIAALVALIVGLSYGIYIMVK